MCHVVMSVHRHDAAVDNKIIESPGCRHSDFYINNTSSSPFIHKFVIQRITGLSLHDVRFSFFIGQ